MAYLGVGIWRLSMGIASKGCAELEAGSMASSLLHEKGYPCWRFFFVLSFSYSLYHFHMLSDKNMA